MRVLIIANHFYPDLRGGAEISVYNYCRALTKNKNISSVAVITIGEKKLFENIDGIRVYRIKKKYKFNYERKNKLSNLVYYFQNHIFNFYKKEIINIIEDYSPNIIHTQNIDGMGNVWGICKKTNGIIVHTIRDDYLIPDDLFCGNRNKSTNKLRHYLNAFIKFKRVSDSKDIDMITTISDIYKIKYEKNLNRDISFIPNFFIDSEINKLRSIYTDSNEIYTFGYIGRISKEKGVDILLDAFMKVSLSYKDCRLLIAGNVDNEFAKNLIKKYKSENVVFLNKCEPEFFYSKVNTVIIPSLWEEAFGRVAIESVICKKNIIVSDSGALVEVLSRVGADFDFYPKLNVIKLQELMDKNIQSRACAKNDFVDISPYSESIVISEYMKLFNSK